MLHLGRKYHIVSHINRNMHDVSEANTILFYGTSIVLWTACGHEWMLFADAISDLLIQPEKYDYTAQRYKEVWLKCIMSCDSIDCLLWCKSLDKSLNDICVNPHDIKKWMKILETNTIQSVVLNTCTVEPATPKLSYTITILASPS